MDYYYLDQDFNDEDKVVVEGFYDIETLIKRKLNKSLLAFLLLDEILTNFHIICIVEKRANMFWIYFLGTAFFLFAVGTFCVVCRRIAKETQLSRSAQKERR